MGWISIKELWVATCLPLAGPPYELSPISSMNRPCDLVLYLLKETRMSGGVGAGGLRPPATRFERLLLLITWNAGWLLMQLLDTRFHDALTAERTRY